MLSPHAPISYLHQIIAVCLDLDYFAINCAAQDNRWGTPWTGHQYITGQRPAAQQINTLPVHF